MILHEKTKEEFSAEFETSGVWQQFYCQCDYCGETFLRSKRNITVGRTILQKESCSNKKCTQQKRQESQLLKYGVENAGGTKESLEKNKKTCLEKYGVDNAAKVEEFKDKAKTTSLERYGKTSYLATEENRAALKKHCLEFGVENPGQVPEYKEKAKQTCQQTHGKPFYSQTDEMRERVIKTTMEKHGVPYYALTNEYKEKRKKTCLERYGVEHPLQTAEVQAKIRNTCLERYGTAFPNSLCGKTQRAIGEWINNLGYDFSSSHKIIPPYEIDLYSSSIKVGIEYCGLFWHNECSPKSRDEKYHIKKMDMCKEKGVRLITLFEDEWINRQEQCKAFIRASLSSFDTTIAARKCSICEIEQDKANEFIENFHIQGQSSRGSLANFALFNEEEIVGVMQLGRHHRQNVDATQIVLTRLCFKPGIRIIGGSNKLFKPCKLWAKEKGYSKIISWSDNRWSEGKVYESMGFEMEEEYKPDYSYVVLSKPFTRLSKQSQRKKAVGCPDNITERDWAISRGLARIWDCGKKRWAKKL